MIHALLIIIAFGGVLFSEIPMGSSIQKVVIILFISIGIFGKIKNKSSFLKTNLIIPYLLYLIYCFISAYYTSGSLVYVLSSLLPLLIGIGFYFSLITIKTGFYQIDEARRLFLLLCVIQIAFSVIKLITHGVDEKILIGSMSHVAGQLGFLFPATAIPLIFYFMKNGNQFQTWLLTCGLIGFGLINEKRAIVFVIPLIIYASMLANENHLATPNKIRRFSKMVLISPLVLLAAFLGISVIPSLNSSSDYGGAVDILFSMEYAVDYLTMDYGDYLQGSYQSAMYDENVQVGRITLILSIVEWLNASSWSTQLFGVGFGAATPSEWLGGQGDPLFGILGTRGAISGAGLALVETGILGLGLFIYFFFNLRREIKIQIKNSDALNAVRWYKTVLVIFYVFLFDFFFYSTSLFRTMPMPILFFAIIATLSMKNKKTSKK